jgi:hypothetical protein
MNKEEGTHYNNFVPLMPLEAVGRIETVCNIRKSHYIIALDLWLNRIQNMTAFAI